MITPGRDWTAVKPFPFAAARRTFTGMADEAGRIAIRYFRRGPAGPLVAIADFGPRSEGAPGQVHGGGILTVLDEALGAAAWLEGVPVLTVRLNAEFRKSVPLGARLLVETELGDTRRKLVSVRGRLLGPDGARYATAEAAFIRLNEDAVRRLFGLAWERS